MNSASFQARNPGLVWSVSRPDAGVLIRAALLAPRFRTLLDACVEFGVARVRSEWQTLSREESVEVRRSAEDVERMMRHIEEGWADAQV